MWIDDFGLRAGFFVCCVTRLFGGSSWVPHNNCPLLRTQDSLIFFHSMNVPAKVKVTGTLTGSSTCRDGYSTVDGQTVRDALWIPIQTCRLQKTEPLVHYMQDVDN